MKKSLPAPADLIETLCMLLTQLLNNTASRRQRLYYRQAGLVCRGLTLLNLYTHEPAPTPVTNTAGRNYINQNRVNVDRLRSMQSCYI